MWLSDDGLNLRPVVKLILDAGQSTDCLSELVKYVHEIAETYPAPYTLFVSGGIDSQAMLYSWKLSGIPFNAVNVNYLDFNAHDRKEIVEFCQQHDVPLQIVDFDVIDFLENRMEEYAMKYSCASPHLCTHMAFSELIQTGTKLFSGNLASRALPLDNTIFGLQRYANLSGNSVVPFFLLQSEEVSKASIALADTAPPDAIRYKFKCWQYQQAGIPIIPQADKLTGFENLKNHYDQYQDRVTNSMKLHFSTARSKRVFDQLFRNKYLAKLKNHYDAKIVITEVINEVHH
jgi:hypothetical protein